jgi:hypothetical protein
VDALLTHFPFPFFDKSAITIMRLYLIALAEVLRAFREEVEAMDHDLRYKWYRSINKFHNFFERARRTADIESWDVMLLLKSCQYLVCSIQDEFTNGEVLFEFGRRVVKGVLQGYGPSTLTHEVLLKPC